MAASNKPSGVTVGRLDGSNGTAVVAGDFALGAGWGNTASIAVTSGSTDQRGEVTVTSAGTGQSQATATVTLTFTDGAYASAPFAVVCRGGGTATETDGVTAVATTTTTLVWNASILPVDSETTKFSYIVVQ